MRVTSAGQEGLFHVSSSVIVCIDNRHVADIMIKFHSLFLCLFHQPILLHVMD